MLTFFLCTKSYREKYKKESNKKCTCTSCGNPVSKYKFSRYGGLCDACLVKQVNIEQEK